MNWSDLKPGCVLHYDDIVKPRSWLLLSIRQQSRRITVMEWFCLDDGEQVSSMSDQTTQIVGCVIEHPTGNASR